MRSFAMRIGIALLLVCAAVTAGCGDDGDGTPGVDGGSTGCGIETCFRPVECVATCGGPVLSSSCCPCPSGQLDRFVDCPRCEDTPGCVNVCEGGACECMCTPADAGNDAGASPDGG